VIPVVPHPDPVGIAVLLVAAFVYGTLGLGLAMVATSLAALMIPRTADDADGRRLNA